MVLQMGKVESQSHCLGLGASPPIQVIQRHAQRGKQLVPGFRADHRASIAHRTRFVSLEVGCVQSEPEDMTLHDPDGSGGISAKPSARITSRQFADAATASFSWISDHVRSDLEGLAISEP